MAGAAGRGRAGLGGRGGGEVRGGEEQHPGDVPRRAQGQVRVRHQELWVLQYGGTLHGWVEYGGTSEYSNIWLVGQISEPDYVG